VDDFSSSKAEKNLDFVATLKQAFDLFAFDLKVVLTDLGSHLDLSQ